MSGINYTLLIVFCSSILMLGVFAFQKNELEGTTVLYDAGEFITEPEWIPERYFPRFTPGEKVYSLKVNCPIRGSGPSSDSTWRMDRSDAISAALTLVGMQGLINREAARLYIHWQDTTHPAGVSSYDVWLDRIRRHNEIVTLDLDAMEAIRFLYEEYQELFHGVVLYDHAVPETINLASMIAGLESRIIAGPHQLAWQPFDSITQIRDLRKLVHEQGWQADFDSQLKVYQWVYDNLWPSLEHRMIGFSSPGPPTSIDRETGSDGFYFPVDIAHRDYDVALKLPVLYLNPKYADHLALLEKFLSEVPAPTPILGVTAFNEHGVVQTASKFGHFVPALNWPGQTLSCGNLTVLSAIRPQIVKNGPDLDPSKILATVQEPGPFVTLFSSDGDALFYQMDRGFYPFFLWEDVRGQPFNWENNPLLSEIAPVIWNYYQETAQGTYSMAGLSGIGYTRPQLMDSIDLENYLRIGAPYLAESGLRVLRIDGNGGLVDERISKQYYRLLNNTGYLGSLISFLPSANIGINLKYLDHPAPMLQESFTINAINKDQIIQSLLEQEPRRFKIEIEVPGNVPEVQIVLDDSASVGTAVKVDKAFFQSPSYSLIYSTGPLSLEPGDYTATYLLKVDENTGENSIAYLYGGIDFTNPDWVQLGNATIRASDFKEADTYQGFGFEFTLSELTTDVELRIDYGEGGTDLWVDYILLENDNEQTLPVFAPLYMSLGIDPDIFEGMNSLAGDFAKNFEPAGGVILSANEFFAALNPKFMIAFAEGLEHDDVLLTQAKNQFSAGQYYQSLISVRQSLKETVHTTGDKENLNKDQIVNIFPNPARQKVYFFLNVGISQPVKVTIFNLQGILIKNLYHGRPLPGELQLSWQIEEPGQAYIAEIVIGETRIIRKIVGL